LKIWVQKSYLQPGLFEGRFYHYSGSNPSIRCDGQKWKAVSDKVLFTTAWLEETTLEFFFMSESFLRHAKRLKKPYQIKLRIEIWRIGQQPKVNFKAIFVKKMRPEAWFRFQNWWSPSGHLSVGCVQRPICVFFYIPDSPSDLGPSYLKGQKTFFFGRSHPVM